MAAAAAAAAAWDYPERCIRPKQPLCSSFIIYFAAPALIRHISTEGEAADEHAGLNICLQLIATLSSFDVLPFFEGRC